MLIIRFPCLIDVDYEAVKFVNIKNVKKERVLALITIICLIKTTLWNARQSVLNTLNKWTVHSITTWVKIQTENRFCFEVDKWGWRCN